MAELSEYRIMWLVCMFDLPTTTKKQKDSYISFRKFLMEDGFTMIQYSVYARPCKSVANTKVHMKRIEDHVPEAGEIRMLKMTDAQYGDMKIFRKKMKAKPENGYQSSLFF